MQPALVDAKAIAEIIEHIDVRAALKTMFAELANESAVQPAQTLTLFPNDRGDFINYQGVLAKQGVFGSKLSPYIIGEHQNLVTAWTCLMSMKTGEPLLLCDAKQLTTERTAGTTALAVEKLAKPTSNKLAIIGSGSVAVAHWQHVRKLRDWKEVRVWSPNLEQYADRRSQWSSLVPNLEVANSAESAAKNADVVMLCTSSGTPVIESNAFENGALITSISTNVTKAHEVHPQLLLSSEVYCDYRMTTPASAGEMLIAERDHNWSAKEIVGDLPELVTENCPRPSGSKPIFFRSLGLGLEDIAMANEVYKALNSTN